MVHAQTWTLTEKPITQYADIGGFKCSFRYDRLSAYLSGDHVIRSAEVHMTTSEFSSLDSHSWEDWFKLSKNCSCHPPNRPEVVIGSMDGLNPRSSDVVETVVAMIVTSHTLRHAAWRQSSAADA
ncbi:hypothetical protein J6590_104024 [Homalodisca vitripennis]|nr:hypothetical protein J6590_104024 [Homalodisca vitripennis]